VFRAASAPHYANRQPRHAIALGAAQRQDRRASGVTACRRYGDTSPRPAGGQLARHATLMAAAGLFT